MPGERVICVADWMLGAVRLESLTYSGLTESRETFGERMTCVAGRMLGGRQAGKPDLRSGPIIFS